MIAPKPDLGDQRFDNSVSRSPAMLFSSGRSGCLLSLGYPDRLDLTLSRCRAGLKICAFGRVLALFGVPA